MTASDLPEVLLPLVTVTAERKIEAKADSPLALVGALAAWARDRGIDLPDLEVSRPTLEDVYLELTEGVR
jgi:ABC-2 type transport system ATP-binding protein